MSHTGVENLPTEVDVLIAGGGPSGLFLALDLADRGIATHVLEPRTEIDWTRPRAKTTNARTMTHLRRLGLADDLRRAAPLSVGYSEDVIFCTSLIAHELIRFRHAFQLHADGFDLQPECGQQVPQPTVEQLLRDALQLVDHSALHLGVSFVAADPVEGGWRATVQDATGGQRTVDCRYLIGADGVASTVRRGLGVRLEGSSAAKSNLGLVFRSAQLAEVVRLDPAVQYWIVGHTYAGMIGPLDRSGLWWTIVQGYDAAAPKFAGVTPEHVLRTMIGTDVDIDLIAQDPWTARMLLAPTYGQDNAYLVGDAAHANPPWGGHGFNTCIGDAANLAWKLAAVLEGWAGPDLLDSYEAERRPVARRTIDEAVANGMVLADDLIDADIDDDGPAGQASRNRAAEQLMIKESEFHSLGLVLGYDYGQSPVITPSGSTPPAVDPIHYRPSAAPGCVLPHAWLDDTTSLYDELGRGFTLLIDEAAEVDVPEAAVAGAIPLEVRSVRHPTGSFSRLWEAPMVLVRPDQHVAWRGADPAELPAALRRAAGF